MLLSHGSNVSATNKDGNTPLHGAAQNRNKTKSKKLLESNEIEITLYFRSKENCGTLDITW